MVNKSQELARLYIDAVWSYFLEHSDLTKEGSYLVKFHTENKQTFNRRILARIRGYHRDDPRYGTKTPEEKDRLAQSIKTLAIQKKLSKVKEPPRTLKQKTRSLLIRTINRLFE